MWPTDATSARSFVSCFVSCSKWTNSIANPVADQFRVFQTDARTDAVMRPIGAGRGKTGRARIKSYLRRIMPETRHRAARMIPRRNEDDALLFLFAEQFDGELLFFLCRGVLFSKFNCLCRPARRN